MKSFKEISYDTFYKMENYHQITIDFVQEAEDLFYEKPQNEEERKDLITNFNCVSYNISITLEIFNLTFDQEISDLIDLKSLIEIRLGYIESLEFIKH